MVFSVLGGLVIVQMHMVILFVTADSDFAVESQTEFLRLGMLYYSITDYNIGEIFSF